MKKIFIPFAVLLISRAAAQPGDLVVGRGSYVTGGSGVYLHFPGDLRCDGTTNLDNNSRTIFEGNSGKQKLTCVNGTGCTSIYNTDTFDIRMGNVEENNTAGIEININTMVSGVHSFTSGATEIKEGSYWLTNTASTPFSGNDNTSKFFVTVGHGLLLQSHVGGTGTFYPVGSSANTNDYTPVTIYNTDNNDTFGVRVYDNVYYSYNAANGDATGGIGNYRFVKKTWIIHKNNSSTGDVFTVKPQWNLVNEETNFTPHRPSDICVARNHNGYWLPEALQGAASPPTGSGPFSYTGQVTYDNASYNYYPVSVTALNMILADEHISLTATTQRNQNTLSWKVTDQKVAASFAIERSSDKENFQTIAVINIKRNQQNYVYKDTVAVSNNRNIYYRIKETDTATQSMVYSNIVVVKQVDIPGLQLYPNPAHSSFNISVPGFSGSCLIEITDVQGRVLKKFQGEIFNNTSLYINCAGYAKGIYSVKVTNKNNNAFYSKTLIIN